MTFCIGTFPKYVFLDHVSKSIVRYVKTIFTKLERLNYILAMIPKKYLLKRVWLKQSYQNYFRPWYPCIKDFDNLFTCFICVNYTNLKWPVYGMSLITINLAMDVWVLVKEYSLLLREGLFCIEERKWIAMNTFLFVLTTSRILSCDWSYSTLFVD